MYRIAIENSNYLHFFSACDMARDRIRNIKFIRQESEFYFKEIGSRLYKNSKDGLKPFYIESNNYFPKY